MFREYQQGRALLDSIPAVLTRFYLEHLELVCRRREIWEHDYECSSNNLFRRFRMRVAPLSDSSELLVVNSLLFEGEHQAIVAARMPETYVSSEGIVTMCSHCRRVRRMNDQSTWDWAPDYVAHPPHKISHGLCGICLDYHYPTLRTDCTP